MTQQEAKAYDLGHKEGWELGFLSGMLWGVVLTVLLILAAYFLSRLS